MRCLIFLLCLIPSSALAVQLLLNDERMDVESVQFYIDDDLMIFITCEHRPDYVALDKVDWRQQIERVRHSLGKNQIKSFQFTTTENPEFTGWIMTNPVFADPPARTQWISNCPGGTPIGPRCIAGNDQQTVLRWAQRRNTPYCTLRTNATYHINVRNSMPGQPDVSTCKTDNCSFLLSLLNNRKP